MGAEMEILIAACICLVAAAVGLPSLKSGAGLRWLWGGLSLLGLVGFLVLLIWSARARWGVGICYAEFHPGPFFLLILVGATLGLWLGTDRHSRLLGVGGGAAGACLGYVLGIFAGLRLQALGPIGTLLGLLTYVGVVTLAVLDLVLIVLVLF